MPLRDPDGPRLPEPVAAFGSAVNARDVGAGVDSFADRALVNDELQEHWGRQAITEWASRQIVGLGLSIDVHRVVHNGDHTSWPGTLMGASTSAVCPIPSLSRSTSRRAEGSSSNC